MLWVSRILSSRAGDYSLFSVDNYFLLAEDDFSLPSNTGLFLKPYLFVGLVSGKPFLIHRLPNIALERLWMPMIDYRVQDSFQSLCPSVLTDLTDVSGLWISFLLCSLKLFILNSVRYTLLNSTFNDFNPCCAVFVITFFVLFDSIAHSPLWPCSTFLPFVLITNHSRYSHLFRGVCSAWKPNFSEKISWLEFFVQSKLLFVSLSS